MRTYVLGATVALLIVGCGDGAGDPPKYGATYIEKRLPILYARRASKSAGEIRDVTCVRRTTRVYRCVATVKVAAYPKPEEITVEVTINPNTGRFVTSVP